MKIVYGAEEFDGENAMVMCTFSTREKAESYIAQFECDNEDLMGNKIPGERYNPWHVLEYILDDPDNDRNGRLV